MRYIEQTDIEWYIGKSDVTGAYYFVNKNTKTDITGYMQEHDKRIREEVIDEFYNLLANEFLWVLGKFGNDVYMDIRNSIYNAQCILIKQNE